ncbi:MAG: sulfate adenylyltransferase, partial [Armatimonadetes bacterium]|nr:sulfate adenylyltransferase [Armatimonadota bacterium]
MSSSLPKSSLNTPYGGALVDLCVSGAALRERAGRLPSLQLSERSACDLEMLAVGGFSPLDRFMGAADYQRVVAEMRLADGTVFPIPITLPIDDDFKVTLDGEIALRDAKNDLLAVMTVHEIFQWDPDQFRQAVPGTRDPRHPLVAESARWGRRFISGPLQVLQLPVHYDYRDLRLTPVETRQRLEATGYARVVAFQTRNPLHRAHEELTRRAIEEVDGVLLLHPVVGMTKPGDVDHFTRVRTYKVLTERYFDRNRVVLSLAPFAMRLAGPREALWHAIIRRNYGSSHLIVGRDHASPGLDSEGHPFYGPYDAQELVERFQDEVGVRMVPFREMLYLREEDRYEEASRVAPEAPVASLSGTQVREEYLNSGRLLPDWFTRPDVARILAEAYPPRHRQGACLWFTGLSDAGKSTTADLLTVLLMERGRQVTVLDGDVVRTHLSRGLGRSAPQGHCGRRRARPGAGPAPGQPPGAGAAAPLDQPAAHAA